MLYVTAQKFALENQKHCFYMEISLNINFILLERVQGTMHVPGALPQDLDAPYLFHVLNKGKGSGVPAVLLLVLPVRKSIFSKSFILVTQS